MNPPIFTRFPHYYAELGFAVMAFMATASRHVSGVLAEKGVPPAHIGYGIRCHLGNGSSIPLTLNGRSVNVDGLTPQSA